MIKRLQMTTWTVWAVAAVAASLAVGCIENRASNRAEGDDCRSSAECAPGLACVGLTCVPNPPAEFSDGPGGADFAEPITPRDAGFNDPDLPPPRDVPRPEDDTIEPPDDVVDPPTDVPDRPDGPLCTPGERECATNREIRICNSDGDGFTTEVCAAPDFCAGGACEARETCEDRDGDGFTAGFGCPGGSEDCNDDNPTVFPGAGERCDGLDNDCDRRVDEDTQRRCASACGTGFEVCVEGRFAECTARQPSPEVCGNRLDDNCDGEVDEGCEGCEPGSCPRGLLCVDDECREVPDDECLFQNQPCNAFRTEGNFEFICIDFGGGSGGSDGICMGRCDPFARDPDDTCPEPNSVCAFEIDQGEAVCLRECDPVRQQGCFESQGCFPLGERGGCVPTGDGEQGEPCDIEAGIFDQCEAGLLCTEIDQFGPTCERLCSPFSSVEDRPEICGDGTACFAFEPDIGLCLDSLEQEEGSECANFAQGTMCSTDVICAPVGRRESQCQRLCRFENGREDCINGGRCRESRLGLEGVGVCR